MLLNDDFVENSRLEVLLKKVGFDVMALGTEAGLSDRILSFRPDLVVAAGSGKVSPLSVGQKLKDNRSYSGSVILGVARDVRLNPQDLLKVRMDRLVETPFVEELLLRNLCEVLSLDAEAFIEKLRKSQWTDAGVESQMVKGSGEESARRSVTGSEPRSPNRVVESGSSDQAAANQTGDRSMRPTAGETGNLRRLDQATAEPGAEKSAAQSLKPGSQSQAEPSDISSENQNAAGVFRSRLSPQERAARFEKALANLDIPKSDTTLKRTEARDKWTNVKKDWDLKKIEDQNELKKAFAGALFVPDGKGQKTPGGSSKS